MQRKKFKCKQFNSHWWRCFVSKYWHNKMVGRRMEARLMARMQHTTLSWARIRINNSNNNSSNVLQACNLWTLKCNLHKTSKVCLTTMQRITTAAIRWETYSPATMESTCSSLSNSSRVNLRIMTCNLYKCNCSTICRVSLPRLIQPCLTRTFRPPCSITSRTKQVTRIWPSQAPPWLAITLEGRKLIRPYRWKTDSSPISWKIYRVCLKCNRISSVLVSRIISPTKVSRIFKIRFNSN